MLLALYEANDEINYLQICRGTRIFASFYFCRAAARFTSVDLDSLLSAIYAAAIDSYL